MRSGVNLRMAAMLVALAPGSAIADAKVYHGTWCRPSAMSMEDAPADYFSLMPATSEGAASGQVALGGSLDCPIVRDVTQNSDGLADVEVDIVASEAMPGTAECTLISLARDGKVLATQVRSTSTSGALDFGDSLNVSDALGYYHLACYLPASWTLTRYVVDEPGSGNDGAPGAASMQNGQYYNAGCWCFPAERTAASQNGYFGYPPDGYTTTDPMTCPIVRDNPTSTDGIVDLDVNMIGPGDSTVTCTLYSVAADGSSVQSTTVSSSEQGPLTLDFGNAAQRITSTRSGGSYYLYCSFSDHKDWIVKSYRVVEPTLDDVATPAKLSSAVATGDQKTYTGSFCRPNLVNTFDKSYFMNVAGYYFQVADTPSVLCPLLRDVTSNQNGLADIEFWISAPGEGFVGCGLYVLNAASAIVGQASRGVSFGPEGGVQKIDFKTPGDAISGPGISDDQGPYGIACSLPKGFSIIGYMIEEFASGDSD